MDLMYDNFSPERMNTNAAAQCILTIGVKVRNMKMNLNIYGTWRRVTFEKLMMKIYDFFLFG